MITLPPNSWLMWRLMKPTPEAFLVSLGTSHFPEVASTPGGALKVAPTARAAAMVRTHVPVPEQSPLQPSKLCPLEAAAVKVMDVPCAYLALHVPLAAAPAVTWQSMAGVRPD